MKLHFSVFLIIAFLPFALVSATGFDQQRAPAYKEPRLITRHEAVIEKHGSVVDAETGAGIPDATVIVAWDRSFRTAFANGSGCVLEKIVYTDANGEFTVPDMSNDPALVRDSAGFHGKTSMRYRVAVFKPGYVREGDLESFKNPDPARIGFSWEGSPPDISSKFSSVRLKPIAIRQVDLPAPDHIVYLWTIMHFSSCNPGPNNPFPTAFVDMAKTGYLVSKSKICSLPGSTPVKAQIAMDFERIAAYAGLAKIFATRMNETMKGVWPWTDTTAGTLCRAAVDTEQKP